MASVSTADILVVGAGHNALICAAYLAAADLEVLVVEANNQVGGNTITEELTLPGWRHDSCSSAHVVLQSNPLIRDDELGLLSRHGLRYVHTDPALVMPVEDDALVVRRDLDATADELARWSPADAESLRRMMAEWDSGLATAHARWSAGLPPADDRYDALRRQTAWDVVHRTFTHPVARALMSWLAFATIQPPESPGTGALPSAITSGRLRYGWSTPVGGSGALPAALVSHLAHHGGTVLTATTVNRILVDSHRAAGVRTSDGREYLARHAVISSANLSTLPALLPGQMPAELDRAVRAWHPGLALFAVHLALRQDIRYRGEQTAVAYALGSPDGLRRQARGQLEENDPWLLTVSSTVADPTRAPNGGGVLKLLTTAPSNLDWNEAATKAYADRLITIASRHLDGLTPHDILAVLAESPADLARRNAHNIGGSCHGGAFDLGTGLVVPGWPEYRTPLPGLYLTGSTSHPGGSVSGRPGRNTARCVLADLGINPATVMPGL